MAVFTIGGRELAAALFKAQPFFLAVGQGDAAWDGGIVAPLATDTALVAPIGVTRLRDIQFVQPDDAGEISMADASHWATTQDATRYLYLEFKLDLADAEPATLRENGIYHGTILDGAVPAGQFYIPLDQVTDLGKLIHVDRYNSIIRDGTLEQSFSFILTF